VNLSCIICFEYKWIVVKTTFEERLSSRQEERITHIKYMTFDQSNKLLILNKIRLYEVCLAKDTYKIGISTDEKTSIS